MSVIRTVSHRQHWTVPVSREETLAVREKFQKIGWRPPTHKPQDKERRGMGKECLGQVPDPC
jgi:hypothetical protein